MHAAVYLTTVNQIQHRESSGDLLLRRQTAMWKRRVIKLLWAFLGIITVIYGNADNYRTFRLFNPHCENLWCLRGYLHNWPSGGVLP